MASRMAPAGLPRSETGTAVTSPWNVASRRPSMLRVVRRRCTPRGTRRWTTTARRLVQPTTGAATGGAAGVAADDDAPAVVCRPAHREQPGTDENSRPQTPAFQWLSPGFAARCKVLNLRLFIGETGFEPATARPPAGCATRLRHSPWQNKAGDGNRTRPKSLEGFCATTTLRPHTPEGHLTGARLRPQRP